MCICVYIYSYTHNYAIYTCIYGMMGVATQQQFIFLIASFVFTLKVWRVALTPSPGSHHTTLSYYDYSSLFKVPKYPNLATYNGSFIEQPGYSAYIGCISDSLFPNLYFHYFPFEQIRIYRSPNQYFNAAGIGISSLN